MPGAPRYSYRFSLQPPPREPTSAYAAAIGRRQLRHNLPVVFDVHECHFLVAGGAAAGVVADPSVGAVGDQLVFEQRGQREIVIVALLLARTAAVEERNPFVRVKAQAQVPHAHPQALPAATFFPVVVLVFSAVSGFLVLFRLRRGFWGTL